MRSPSAIPALKRHATGVWYVYWSRRSYYFTRDEAESRVRYLEHIRDVFLPAQQAEALRRTSAAANTPRARALPLVDLAHAWLEHLADERRAPETINSYRLKLAPFLHAFGAMPAAKFDPQLLAAMRTDLIAAGVHPTLLRHRLVAVKNMFAWAERAGYVRGLDLSAVPIGRQHRPIRTIFRPAQVRQLIDRAADETARLPTRPRAHAPEKAAQVRAWMSVQYLAAMRPSEVLRLADRAGEWLLPPQPGVGGVFALAENKTAWAGGARRFVVLSSEAVHHFNALRPLWRSRFQYHDAVHRALGPCGLPHLLRHAAATHLDEAGAREEDIARVLGHGTPGALSRYMRVARQRLLPTAALLSLRCDGELSAALPLSCPCDPDADGLDELSGAT